MTPFEGGYHNSPEGFSAEAVLECKICWTPYDPAEGDSYRQIDPGTAFRDLPEDWSCPNCGAPKEHFLVNRDPGASALMETVRLRGLTDKLVADFREIWNGKMRDVPMVNRTLSIEAIGFRMHDGRPLGVLLSPWFMNLIQLPGEDEDWSGLTPGEKESIAFPSGEYEFIHNTRETIGGYKACSLFSMMGDFGSQKQAVDVANAVMVALFDPEVRAETDRKADIRASREAELAAAAPVETGDMPVPDLSEPTRRGFITAGLAEDAQN
ncbi:[NiFe]-hydrogenase assembly chaperone HybE [Roseibacterium beibuensis]|uniref:[NiFe]-hydrogenase assembly chaperone HybE n=1 Tax=[Roseibacterium] beibuensis TaxID=1193142 RepID=A0ABP9KYX1_9RHOB|nr:[NiFe]-hydrogenase assembly chaperone HybE [Roseibacterium beibuensis]MCS6622013.1 [NiFe]-hydrogenase assembly chaperone HybE [Roseibacterium beibuensis]